MELIPPILYIPIYLSIITLVTLFLLPKYSLYEYGEIGSSSTIDKWVTLIIVAFFVVLIGFRPPILEYFADTQGYAVYFEYLQSNNIPFEFDFEKENVIFDNLLEWMASEGFTYTYFFTLISFLYFVGAFWACKRFFPGHILASYIVWLAAFSTYSSGVNGIKAGVACVFFIIAISYKNEKILLSILLLLIAWGFHHSMHLCLAAFGLALVIKNTKLYIFIWIVCIILAAANVTFFQELLSEYTDDKGFGYLTLNRDQFDKGYYTGFRLDFILYSAVPIALGYYTIIKKKIEDNLLIFTLNVYIIINSLWILCMYASYSNRIASLSWSIFPILIAYPFLRTNFGENKYKYFAVVMIINLSFNLFMKLVYYSIESPMMGN